MTEAMIEEGTMLISAAQLRAARGLLGWTRQRLAEAARVDAAAIAAYEDDGRPPERREGEAIARAVEAAGVLLIGTDSRGEGVRFARPQARSAEGIRPEDLNSANDG